MGFLGVYTASYDYSPTGDNELEIKEGDLLYILEKDAEDDWWKAKKKAVNDSDEEPIGLIPNNYVEEAHPTNKAKALYDYTRQTDEEVSFSEDAVLDVYDTSDPDWTLVGFNGDYGFAPANYIEIDEAASETAPRPTSTSQPSIQSPATIEPEVSETVQAEAERSPPESPVMAQNPATALAGILNKQQPIPPAEPPTSSESPVETPRTIVSPPLPARTSTYSVRSETTDSLPPTPARPGRPPSIKVSPAIPNNHGSLPVSPGPRSVVESPSYNRVSHQISSEENRSPISGSGYHLYNINEMVSYMGKRRKLPTTLGINIATGTIMIAPEKSRDGPQQEWTAEKLTHYSLEGKHVFMELVRPSRSIDFHAGAKDTAEEIVSALGEMAGAVRAEGLREVLAAGSGLRGGHKTGKILYDFMAQGDDEVTVADGDEVVILDDTKSDEWWMVRRLKNGKEGVVPSSYIEVTGITASSTTSGVAAGLSTVEQNRLEEERLAKEAARQSRQRGDSDARSSQGHRRGNSSRSNSNKPKPDMSKIRTWTDRSGSFKVDAQFIGLKDGKIHLHKLNGVKIAVPVAKMSVEDLDYVESVTGVSLDEDKPLSDIRRRSLQKARHHDSTSGNHNFSIAGAAIQKDASPEYDWFDFFLKCGVGPYQCERYAQNFSKDQMDEKCLPDITPEILRTLGFKEGDIIRVMKFLDTKFGRTGARSKLRNVSYAEDGEEDEGGDGHLFSGPGGALRNNTRKSRPAPPVQTNDTIDPKVFQTNGEKQTTPESKESPSTTSQTPAAEAPARAADAFEDDAWAVKPSKQPAAAAPSTDSTPAAPAKPAVSAPAPAPPATVAPVQQPALTGALADLSLLTPALTPTPAPPVQSPQIAQATMPAPVTQPQQPQPTGATPAFFQQLPPQQTGLPQATTAAPVAPPMGVFVPQQTGFGQPQLQPQQTVATPRQRPQAPQIIQQGSLPPPPRPFSAPQNFPQPNSFGPPQPLQPQLTGIPQLGTAAAAPGHSLNELSQQKFQQQQQQQFSTLQPQPTGMSQTNQPFGQYPNQLQPQPTGFVSQPQQPYGFQPTGMQTLTAQPTGFQAMAPQPTGFAPGFQQPMQTGISSVLPPTLQQQPTGINGFNRSSFVQSPPPIPPIPQQPTAMPLVPQKTGPAPPVKFGVSSKKLVPQPTGRRANLAQATPQNPFGF